MSTGSNLFVVFETKKNRIKENRAFSDAAKIDK